MILLIDNMLFFILIWLCFSMFAGSNPIYNLLPDILSRLCNQNIKEEDFYNIMQFLINSIKKVCLLVVMLDTCYSFFLKLGLYNFQQDRQMEALVEKLCNRFSGVSGMLSCLCICNHYLVYPFVSLIFIPAN